MEGLNSYSYTTENAKIFDRSFKKNNCIKDRISQPLLRDSYGLVKVKRYK